MKKQIKALMVLGLLVSNVTVSAASNESFIALIGTGALWAAYKEHSRCNPETVKAREDERARTEELNRLEQELSQTKEFSLVFTKVEIMDFNESGKGEGLVPNNKNNNQDLCHYMTLSFDELIAHYKKHGQLPSRVTKVAVGQNIPLTEKELEIIKQRSGEITPSELFSMSSPVVGAVLCGLIS